MLKAGAFFVSLFSLAVLLQFLSGAFHAEFAGYPDESAHYVTGMMVRSYLTGLQYTHPMEFAANYAAQYPKVALGHWPPFFYLVEALWTIPFSYSRASVLALLAFTSTLTAWLLFREIRSLFGAIAGRLAAALFLCVPLVQIYSAEVMAESLLTLVTFAAALAFARYLERERWQDSLLFGILAALAILTKGSGWDLAIVPPAAILLTRQFALLRRWSFWLPALVVCVLCAPWQILTMSMVQRGWQGGDQPSLAYTLAALRDFLVIYAGLLGWAAAALVLAGIAVACGKRPVKPVFAAALALIFAAWLFHSLVPAGVEPRKLIVAVPAVILFFFSGIDWLSKRLRLRPALVALAALAVFALEKFSIPKEIHNGYLEAAAFIHAQPDLKDALILVSSEHDGEGMLISELAMRGRDRNWRILRGTKTLARTDWNGKLLQNFYPTPEELFAYLKQAHIALLVTDTLPPAIAFDFQNTVRETLRQRPSDFTLAGTFTGQLPGAVYVYRVR